MPLSIISKHLRDDITPKKLKRNMKTVRNKMYINLIESFIYQIFKNIKRYVKYERIIHI